MAEIEKIAVYDSRIIQDPPKYAVQKGALSVSTSQFQANAANASQLSFQVLVPSLNVFTDRKIELNASAYCYAEAVPTQQVSLFPSSNTQNGLVVPPGRYIESPYSYAQQYALQQTPVTATFPSNGTSWNAQGNSACVLPANSWPGLTENLSQGALATDANYDVSTPNTTLPATAFPSPIGGGNIAYIALTGSTFANPFTKFAGSNVATTMDVECSILGVIDNIWAFAFQVPNGQGFSTITSTPNIGQVTATLQLVDAANANTVFGTISRSLTVGSPYSTGNETPGQTDLSPFSCQVSSAGTSSIVINGDSVYTTPAQLQWRVSFSATNFLQTGTGNANLFTIRLTDCDFRIQGFNSSTFADPVYLNWYQSIGGPADLSLGMFPVQSLATSMTATINDCSVSVTGDVLREQLLLSQTRDSLMQRTCASKFDVYAWSQDDARSDNGALQSYENAKDSDIPNGSYPLTFVHPKTGKAFQQFDAYEFNGVIVPIINFRPAFIPMWSNLIGQTMPTPSLTISGTPTPTWVIKPTDATKACPIMFLYRSVEPLCLSPFLWQDSKQMTEVGLYGITNMTVNMTLTQPGAVIGYDTGRMVRDNLPAGRLYMDKLSNANGSYGYMTRQSGINALFGSMRLQPPSDNAGNQTGPWFEPPRLLCTFLTPPPEITLPLVSSVPYVEFPRYNSSSRGSFGNPGTVQVQSNTVTLSSIPDLLVVFAKAAFRGQTQGDTYIPITNASVTFDNYANLCSNYSQEDLYACSVAGGLDMDWEQFRGFARGRFPTLTPFASGQEGQSFDTYKGYSANQQLTGSPIVLRMGQDVPLSSGLAPGTLGNYSVQVNLTLDNSNGFFTYLSQLPDANNVIITIMGVNSGFFESVRGSSAIRKTILNTTDVEAASTSSSVTSSQLVRLVGGASGMHTSSRLTTSLGMPQFKPAMGEESRMRKMPRTSHGSMIP